MFCIIIVIRIVKIFKVRIDLILIKMKIDRIEDGLLIYDLDRLWKDTVLCIMRNTTRCNKIR